METEYDDELPPIRLSQGDRSAASFNVRVSHDLGDRTLVLVILLTIVIGLCGVVMGLNLSKQAHLDDQATTIAARLQVQNNQNARIEAQLQEMQNARR